MMSGDRFTYYRPHGARLEKVGVLTLQSIQAGGLARAVSAAGFQEGDFVSLVTPPSYLLER
jgi:hypothetical protein